MRPRRRSFEGQLDGRPSTGRDDPLLTKLQKEHGEPQHAPQACLGCGQMLNAVSDVGGGQAAPEPGNVTVCIYCGHIMVFREALRLDNPTAAEMHAIAGDKRILAIQAVRRRWQQEEKK